MANTKKTVIHDDRGNEIELGTTDIDALYSASAPKYLSAGEHTVRLVHWEVVPEKTVTNRQDTYTTKPYILLDLADSNTNEVTTTRLYFNFVPYFMDNIAAQTDGEIGGMKLSEVLAYLGRHDFTVWVSYDPQRGVQVAYREPRAF